ncbi:LysR family transcriptional regulator (chromosome initiation inhibitor) [Litoreibacter meonggei]|uniref:LysR family transcriptional regulator (Chromosome initiation inhibitor) n=1 Tax=Litoreibacter meonggei TaxID=1049199 RepID=A0A497X0Z1_9RHOB|nr:LysR family transcriptional regulator ArgP [Litoreibacter meonggei]RLJ59085.1 LysR family transcriptional regulator (chromosome initiation inhibitor) [Litoreibacter meonggei]
MYDYSQLEALCAVIRTGSFDAAAAQLGVTQSAISQRIKQLEERVGTVLVKRGQPCTGTDAGLKLATHTDQVRLMEKALEFEPSGSERHTPVRIAVNADSLATWLLPALAEHDYFLYDLIIDDQDHSADWLRAGEVAAAVTGHPGPVQGCDSHALGSMRYFATASPDYMARHMPNGPTPEAFERAPAMTFNDKDRLQTDWAKGIAGRPVNLPKHRLASSQGFVEAAGFGLGWGMNPESLSRDALSSGKLVEVAPNAPMDVPLYWQVSRITADPLRPLTKSVMRSAREALIQH